MNCAAKGIFLLLPLLSGFLLTSGKQLDEASIQDCQVLCTMAQNLLIQWSEYKIYQNHDNESDSFYLKFPSLECHRFCSSILILSDDIETELDPEAGIIFPYQTVEPSLIPPPPLLPLPTQPMESEVEIFKSDMEESPGEEKAFPTDTSSEVHDFSSDNMNFRQTFAQNAIQGVLQFMSFARSLGLVSGNNGYKNKVNNTDELNGMVNEKTV